MASDLKVGDFVYVPCAAVPELVDRDTALYRAEVVAVERRSVRVKLPNGASSELIGTSRVHKDVGILVIEVGDFATEAALLDPLAKSVLQFIRLLVPDDQVRAIKVRSRDELQKFWLTNQAAFSHVVLIGHGGTDALGFAVDGDVAAADVINTFAVVGAPSKTFISLACKTGYATFGGKFSRSQICKEFIAPFHSVHGAIASQFCQTFFTSHFLEGRSAKVAFNHARTNVPGGVSFRLWTKGFMQLEPRESSPSPIKASLPS